jgi:hypothetical protein
MIAFYGFQRVPNVQVVRKAGGWQGWITEWADPLRALGVLDHHLHNPFGLHHIRDRDMHIDQFELTCRDPKASWLADPSGFASAIRQVHATGGKVAAYIGSPLVIPPSLRDVVLPDCSPGAMAVASQLESMRQGHLCGGVQRCICWSPLVKFYLKTLLDARIDRIGFDFSANFLPGSCMDELVRGLIGAGIEVMIEPWPHRDRPYPPVAWITREVRFQRVRLRPRDDEVPLGEMTAPIYRIVPADDTDDGREEIAEINDILGDRGPIGDTQDIVDRVIKEGHNPLVRARQLSDGSVRVAT